MCEISSKKKKFQFCVNVCVCVQLKLYLGENVYKDAQIQVVGDCK